MRGISLLLVALLFPTITNAISVATASTECSGLSSVDLGDMATFTCAGDFSLLNGSITSDSKIVISADGFLRLENLLITAPIVELTVLNGVLSFGSGVVLNSDYLYLGVGDNTNTSLGINFVSGAVITLGSGDAAGIVTAAEPALSIGQGGLYPLDVGNPILVMSAVPLPGAFVLMLSGMLALVGLRRY